MLSKDETYKQAYMQEHQDHITVMEVAIIVTAIIELETKVIIIIVTLMVVNF